MYENKGKTLYGKDLVNYFVKDLNTPQEILFAKIKYVGFKGPKVLPFDEVLTKQLTNSKIHS